MDKLRGKYISQTEREKLKNRLMDKGHEESRADSLTSGQEGMKKMIAEELSHKSERQREEILKKMGFNSEKRKEFLKKIGGGEMSSAEIKRREKIQKRIKKRNIAASKAMSEQMEEKRKGGQTGKKAVLDKALTEKGAKVGHTALGVKGKSYSVSAHEEKRHSQSDYYGNQGYSQKQAAAGKPSDSRSVAGGFGMVSGSPGNGSSTKGKSGNGGFGLAA